MYVPKPFVLADRDASLALIRSYPFGTLITGGSAGVRATHLPFTAEPAGETLLLRAHLARANPESSRLDGEGVLVTFLGPHGYISPTWYDEPHRSVPTWNYVAVHCYGTARVVTDEGHARAVLATLVDEMESGKPTPWRLDAADPAYIEQLSKAIIVFEIAVDRIEAAAKLSQNRRDAERERVITGLLSSDSAADRELAAAMQSFQRSTDR